LFIKLVFLNFPLKMLFQKPASMKRPRLNSAHGQAKTPSGFGAGQNFQVSMKHHDPQALSKFRNGLPERQISSIEPVTFAQIP
jgi:hypothetical protein